MTRQIVNIGSTGNDGTGDAIRDAFGKINQNFSELYAAQGLEAGIRFETLANVIKPFQPNSLLTVQKNADGSISVNNRVLVSADGYLVIDYDTNPAQIRVSAGVTKVNRDPNPQLINNLDAATYRLVNLGDPAGDQDAVTQQWVYNNFLNRDAEYVTGGVTQLGASTLRKNIRIEPYPNNGNVLLTGANRYLNIKDADGTTARQIDLSTQATDPGHAVRKDYADSKISLTGINTIDPATGLQNKGAGIMTGALILSASPQSGDPDLQAATKKYVDDKSYSSPTNLFVSTIGRDDLLLYNGSGVPYPNPAYNEGQGFPLTQIGRSWAKAFKTLNAAGKYARYLQSVVDLVLTPYSVLPSAITPYRPTYNFGGATTRVKVNLAGHGYVTGDYVDVKGAINTAGQQNGADTTNLNGIWKVYNVYNSAGIVDPNNFILNITTSVLWTQPNVVNGGSITIALANQKDGAYTASSRVGRGYSVKKLEITIFMESGVYAEKLPVALPVNVALKGDEFRRTIIRPAVGPAGIENKSLVFVRGDRSVPSTNWQTYHYYHQLASIATAAQNSTNITISGAAYAPKDGLRFYIQGGAIADNGVGTQYRVANAVQLTGVGVLPGTYQCDVVDDQYDPKPLEATLANGSTIEFFLDNEHCDVMLVNDAHQSRNMSWFGHKGNIMAFDPAGQILTRSPYGQVCASFSARGGGGQFIDGAAGNQYVTVYDTAFNDGLGNTGATGQYITIRGTLRAIQVPNTFYYNKKKYVILAATTPDGNGTVRLTLSSTTPIVQDDTFLPLGYIPINAQILIETAGNRSMLSNDFTMLNDLGYGILADNNGVTESVSQFTYYCAVSYWAKNGAQVRSVTGSSCYGLIGLKAEGSNPNESIQIANLTHDIVLPFTPYIEDPTTQGIVGSTSILITNLPYAPLRNATFQLDAVNVNITSIVKQTPTIDNTTPPLLVTTAYRHPFLTGQSVKFINLPGGLDTVSGTPINNGAFTITYLSDTTFTINSTDSTLYTNNMTAADSAGVQPQANGVLTANAKNTTIAIKGDPTDQQFTGNVRFDSISGENGTTVNVLKVYNLLYPAVKGMKFTLSTATPAISGVTSQVYKVVSAEKKEVKFQVQAPTVSDNLIGATTLIVTNLTSGYVPKAGWTFQLLDPSNANRTYTKYTVSSSSTAGLAAGYYALTITPALTVQPPNQAVGTGNYTYVDGHYDLTLDRNLLVNLVSSNLYTVYFNNAVWAVTLNPALDTAFGLNTSGWGDTTTGYTKKFLLFQQKSVKVTQVLDTPQIILSSALAYGSASYDSTIYRIIGKDKTTALSTAVFKLASSASPNLGLFPIAKTAILNNNSFLINEAVAYVNYTYPTLVYNATKCARDVGYILNAIENDIIVGGATASLNAGRQYWNSGVNVIGGGLGQVSAEVASLGYVKTLLTKVLQESAATGLKQPAVVTQVTSGSAAETGGYQTAQTLVDIVRGYVNNGYNFQNAASLLTLNKSYIAAETIAYINRVYNTLTYDPSALNTQIQNIVTALATDIVNGNATAITTQTNLFFTSGTLNITGSQATDYIDAFKNWMIPVMTNVIGNVSINPGEQSVVTQNLVPITVAETGSAAQVTALMTSLTNSIQYGRLTFTNSKTNLANNSAFIKAELIAYINATYVTGQANPISYHRTNYGTQVTGLVTALVSDLNTGGAAAVGNYVLTTYFTGGNSNAGNTFFTSPATGPLDAALGQLRVLLPAIIPLNAISTTAYGATKQVFYSQSINGALIAEPTAGTTLVTGGAVLTVQNLIQSTIDIVNYGYNFTNAAAVLTANRSYIQAEIIAFIDVTYQNFNYNRTKCSRDIGLIVDAVSNDLIYGGNSNSLSAALQYYVGGVLQVPGNQQGATVASILRINAICAKVLLNDAAQPFTSLQTGIRQTYLNGTTVESNALVLFQQNITFIAGILQNGPATAPTLNYSNNVQTLTFGPDATDLYYGGVITGPNIPGPVNAQDATLPTTIRASQRDPLGSGNYIVKISQAITGSISANTEITVTGPGYDFIFDFNTGMNPRHVAGDQSGITTTFSTVRATAHDFLEVGSGGFDDSNYPHNIYGQPNNTPSSGALVSEVGTGRVFHVSTDQDGNFRVGTYFNVNQGDGSVSLQANINLTNVSGLGFTSGAIVNQFSQDETMGGTTPADNIVSTQKATVAYIKGLVKGTFSNNTQSPYKGLMTLDGSSKMVGPLKVNGNTVEGVINSTDSQGIVNRKYVDNVFAGGTITYDGLNAITVTSKRTDVLSFTMLTDSFGPGGPLGNYGAINLNGNKLLSVRTPTQASEGANKQYVDTAIATGGTRTGWSGFTLATAPSTSGVQTIAVGNGGSGYTYAPTVTIGDPVTGTAWTSGGSGVTNGAFYYYISTSGDKNWYQSSGTGTFTSTPPTFTTGTGSSVTYGVGLTYIGTAATAESTVNAGVVTGFSILNPGSGYSTVPNVIVGGSIGTPTIVAGGNLSTTSATITFSPPPVNGGIRATGILTVSQVTVNTVTINAVTGITITNPGSGYTVAPTATISGTGNGATATVTIDGQGQVQNNFIIVTAGSGYSSVNPPIVTFVGGGGSGATATCVVNVNGTISTINLVTSGSGYIDAPQVVIGVGLTITVAPGANATGVAAIGFKQTFIDMNSNRIKNLSDPLPNSLYYQDPVTLNYLNNNLKLSKLSDVTIGTNPSPIDGDLLMFTGVSSNAVNVTRDQTVVSGLNGADIVTGSHIVYSRDGNTYKANIVSGAIVDAQIRATAAIAQSKLNLSAATATLTAGTTPTAAQLGVAHFVSTQFNSNSGLISLKDSTSSSTGAPLSALSWISANSLLGNLTANSAAVGSITVDSLKTALNISGAVAAAITDTTLQSPSTQGNYGAVLNRGSTYNSGTTPIRGTLYFQFYNQDGTTYDNTTQSQKALMPGHPSNLVSSNNGASTLYDMGSSTAKWGTIYCKNIVADSITGGGATPAVSQSVQGILSASDDIIMSTPAGSVTSYNGSTNTSIKVNGDVSATANTIAKRDGSGGLTVQNLKVTGELQSLGTGSGYTSNYYSLIKEDASTGTRFTAIMRRDYSSGSGQTIGMRIGSNGDNNNYSYAQYHVFNTYSSTATGAPAASVAYIDAPNAKFFGTATAALYADLAEKYLPDAEYGEGTVLVFGGDKEVTTSTGAYDKRVAGVISLHPAYEMNSGLEGGVYVALTGRVPCKVIGKVRKGDLMVTSTIPGVAQAADDDKVKIGTVLGKALADYDNADEIGVIEVVIGKC